MKVCKYTPNSRCPSSCCSCHAFSQYFKVIWVKCSADCSAILFQLTNYHNNSTSSQGFHCQRFSNLQPGCTFDIILISSVQYDKILSRFGQRWPVMVNYTCGFKQSETGKHFEWIIIHNINYSFGEWLLNITDIIQFVSTSP